jgi:hypothetical protein
MFQNIQKMSIDNYKFVNKLYILINNLKKNLFPTGIFNKIVYCL